MSFLLDTHIWIWLISYPEKLNRLVRRRLERPNTELFLSPVSIWEAHLLSQRGRVRLSPTFTEWFETASALPIRDVPLTAAIATQACRIRLPQPDPGDLWLAATASVLDLTLVTADRQLIGCSWLKTLANE